MGNKSHHMSPYQSNGEPDFTTNIFYSRLVSSVFFFCGEVSYQPVELPEKWRKKPLGSPCPFLAKPIKMTRFGCRNRLRTWTKTIDISKLPPGFFRGWWWPTQTMQFFWRWFKIAIYFDIYIHKYILGLFHPSKKWVIESAWFSQNFEGPKQNKNCNQSILEILIFWLPSLKLT